MLAIPKVKGYPGAGNKKLSPLSPNKLITVHRAMPPPLVKYTSSELNV